MSEKEQENEDADTDFNKQDDGKLFYSFLYKLITIYIQYIHHNTCTYIILCLQLIEFYPMKQKFLSNSPTSCKYAIGW